MTPDSNYNYVEANRHVEGLSHVADRVVRKKDQQQPKHQQKKKKKHKQHIDQQLEEELQEYENSDYPDDGHIDFHA